jgi:hypothetical protein
MLLFIVTPFELFIVRLLTFVTPDGIEIPDDEPPNKSEEDDEVTRFEGVPAIAGPLSDNVFAPTVKLPAVSVKVPSSVTLPDIDLFPLPEMVRL